MLMQALRHPSRWWRENGPAFNKRVLNPVMLHLAGRRFWYASRLEHVGRRSGRRYATPVVCRRVPGGFAIPLPYGRDVDWLRNLEAAGHAVLVTGGHRHTVIRPQVLDFAGIAPELSWADRLVDRRMLDGDWVRVTAAGGPEPEPADAEPEPADAGTVPADA